MDVVNTNFRRLSRLDYAVFNGEVDLPPNDIHVHITDIDTDTDDPVIHPTSPRKWTLIHIPKAAGDSFMTQSTRHMPKNCSLQGNKEASFIFTSKVNPLVTFLRHPTSHVLSQFLECKYDVWGRRKTNGTGFPGYFETNDTMAGFDEWIRHFVNHAYHPDAHTPPFENNSHYGADMAFRCYDPFNMQSRYLASGKQNKWPHFAWKWQHRFSSLAIAVKHLKTIQVVGIVEHYAASVCLFEYHAGGGRFLTDDCQICHNGKLAVTHTQEHETHHVPPHSISMISPETLALIERNMTLIDQQLYETALRIFFDEINLVRNKTGIDLLCRHQYVTESGTMLLHLDTTTSMTFPTSNFGPSLFGFFAILVLWQKAFISRRQI